MTPQEKEKKTESAHKETETNQVKPRKLKKVMEGLYHSIFIPHEYELIPQ